MATVQFRTALLTVALASLIAAPTAIAQKAKPKAPAVDDSDKEMQLRMRLNMNPHDEEAHRAIQALLRKKYAFHTSMEEDGIWLKNNPDDYNSEIEMRSVAMTINDPEYAIGIDRYILAHANRAPNPEGYDSVSDRLAFLLIGRGKYPEALILLKRATELSPTDAGVWENLADGQVQAGQFSAAVESYKKSLDVDINQENTHEGLALAYFDLGDFQASTTELTAAVAVYNAQYHGTNPTDSWHLMLKNMNDATHSDAGLATLHYKLAKSLLAEKKYDRAITEADIATKADPDSATTGFYLKAEIYDAAGQPTKATATRREAAEAIALMMKKEHPSKDDWFQGFSNVQEIFIMTADSAVVDTADETILLLEPMLSKGNLKPLDRQLLGMAYCTKDRTKECREQIDLAFASEGKWNNATTQYSAGEGLQKSHDPSAVEHFQKAYELDPQNVTFRMDYEASRKN